MMEEKAEKIVRSFDVIGSKEKAVAIVEIPPEISSKKKEIAMEIMRKHKAVKSVLVKASPRTGVYRIREYKLIAGDSDTEVMHKESGLRFLIDPQKAYFSQREGTERQRIVSMVKAGETIMVFFAGVGPFAIMIAKKAKPERVVGIEINPAAVHYFRENIRLNKVKNVEAVEGDVHSLAEQWYGKCDRVLMPLPESAIDFVEEAIKCCKPGGTVHFYCFAKEEELEDFKNKITEKAERLFRNVKFLGHELVLPWGTRIWKVRIDFVVQ